MKGMYKTPEVQVVNLNEDVVRTSEGTKISWNENWGENADFLNGGEF